MKKSNLTIIFYISLILLISIVFYLYNAKVSLFSFKSASNSSPKTIPIKRIGVPFTDKKYQLNFNQQYADAVINIAQFEEDEQWRGDFVIEDSNFMEGLTSYQIFSRGNSPTTITLEKKLNLAKMSVIKMFVFSEKVESGENVKNFRLKFGDKKNSFYYEYQISPALNGGWNLIEMPKNKFSFNFPEKGEDENKISPKAIVKDQWQNIETVTIELTARPASKITLLIDRLWAEKNHDYQNIFKISNSDMISLKQFAGKTYIEVLPFGPDPAYLKNIDSVKNFIYTVKIIPQAKRGTIAIVARADSTNNYGYYLELKGLDDSGWRLYKVGSFPQGTTATVLEIGIINNFVLEKDVPVWLRLITKGEKITGYISFDGNKFTQLTEKNDGELASGGVAIFQGGSSYLIESIDFEQ